jgi:predicted dehydrogenase
MNIGLIGAENSHAKHFCEAINKKRSFLGYAITHLYGGDAPETAAALRNEYQIGECASEDDVIAACDAVVVTYRKGSRHYEPVMKALKAGKAVFNDKPFTTDPAQAAQIIAYAEEHRLLLCGGTSIKSLPGIPALKERVTQGSSVVISYAADHDSPYDGYWFYGIHSAELCVSLCGGDYTGVSAFRNGSVTVVNVAYHDRCCTIVTSPGAYELHVSITRDGVTETAKGFEGFESAAPAEFIKMLETGKPPREYPFYSKSVELTDTVLKSLK